MQSRPKRMERRMRHPVATKEDIEAALPSRTRASVGTDPLVPLEGKVFMITYPSTANEEDKGTFYAHALNTKRVMMPPCSFPASKAADLPEEPQVLLKMNLYKAIDGAADKPFSLNLFACELAYTRAPTGYNEFGGDIYGISACGSDDVSALDCDDFEMRHYLLKQSGRAAAAAAETRAPPSATKAPPRPGGDARGPSQALCAQTAQPAKRKRGTSVEGSVHDRLMQLRRHFESGLAQLTDLMQEVGADENVHETVDEHASA